MRCWRSVTSADHRIRIIPGALLCDPAHVGGLTRQRATLLPRYSAGQALLATSLGPRWGFVGGRTQCYNLTDPLEIQRRPLRSSGINTEFPREDRNRCCSRTLMHGLAGFFLAQIIACKQVIVRYRIVRFVCSRYRWISYRSVRLCNLSLDIVSLVSRVQDYRRLLSRSYTSQC